MSVLLTSFFLKFRFVNPIAICLFFILKDLETEKEKKKEVKESRLRRNVQKRIALRHARVIKENRERNPFRCRRVITI